MTITMHGPFEVHSLPAGVEVAYRDTDHSYWASCEKKPDGSWKGTGRLTGVSTVVTPYDLSPENLIRWAARMQSEGVSILAADGLSLEDADDMRSALAWLQSGEAVFSALQDARLSYRDLRDQAADRGTNVHKHALHRLATGHPVPHYAGMSDEERGYAHGVTQFWMDYEPEPLFAEAVVCDPKLRVAGRLDLIARVPLLGGIVLVDAKTSGFIPTKHHVQLSGYGHCARMSGLVDKIDGQFVLQVGPDGSYELIEGKANTASFAMAVEVYRDSGRIDRECKSARRAAAAPQEATAA